ncbi:MAG: hypothetical protein QOF33_926 [Thermomicrobiales bacterium]|nr:hypothetical protein [Thermomicrobiales bacterium]
MNRRTLLAALPTLTALRRNTIRAHNAIPPCFAYRVGFPKQLLGDGFIIRHGNATESTSYNPGWWHTGECRTGSCVDDSNYERYWARLVPVNGIVKVPTAPATGIDFASSR